MKCQILFSGKNKKNNIILSSAENAQRVVKVKLILLSEGNPRDQRLGAQSFFTIFSSASGRIF